MIVFRGPKQVPYLLEGDVIPAGASPTQLEPKITPFGSNRMWMTRRCDAFSTVF